MLNNNLSEEIYVTLTEHHDSYIFLGEIQSQSYIYRKILPIKLGSGLRFMGD